MIQYLVFRHHLSNTSFFEAAAIPSIQVLLASREACGQSVMQLVFKLSSCFNFAFFCWFLQEVEEVDQLFVAI